jgi:nucleoside 2-deoxyribosyltransferase
MIVVVGGTYRERCIQPRWDALYGSAGTVSFDYVHPLSVPVIQPPPQLMPQLLKGPPALSAQGATVLRFGMMEATAIVVGDRVVYDPQSAYAPEPFRKNGSKAGTLAIVANGYEVRLLTGESDPEAGGRALIAAEGADVVVVKRGSLGAVVITRGETFRVPAYRTSSVFSIGSGDMFAAAFTFFWGVQSLPPEQSAELASKATARYCASQSVELLPRATLEALPYEALTPKNGKVYLAGPFFTLPERWLIEEARTHLRAMHLDVFSPVHDVGFGPAEKIAKADLNGLGECDRVLAIIDSADPGTVFEVGYARARGIPVVALTETLTEEKKKMFVGSGCTCTDDFATALYLTAWAA